MRVQDKDNFTIFVLYDKIQVHKNERIQENQHNPEHSELGIDFVRTAGNNQHKTGK